MDLSLELDRLQVARNFELPVALLAPGNVAGESGI